MPPKAAPHSEFGSTTSYNTLTATYGGNNYSLATLRKALINVNSRAEKEVPRKNEYARVGSLEQAHVDAVAGGDAVSIAAALASWNTARNAYNRKIGSKKGQDIPTAALRKKWDRERRDALAFYEDFLFYQNPLLRRAVAEKVPKTVAAVVRRLENGHWVRGLWYDPINDIGRSHAFLNSWKHHSIGGPTDRRNATHDKLHVITPYPRRQATGVGKPHWPKIRPDRSDQFLVIRANDADIEARRLEIESYRGHTSVDVDMTHNIRRKVEITSKVVENDIVLSQALQYTRNKDTGLYISAKERPTDWPVSYDCLDKVRSGFICIDPRTVTHNHQIEEKRRARERDREDGREVDDGPGRAAGETLEGVQELLLSTQWFEATYGRREFHTHSHLPPSSPVDSPPHSPRPPFYEEGDYNPTVDDDSVTSDTELPAVFAPAVSGRRTRGDDKREAAAAKGAADKIMAARKKVVPRRHVEEGYLKIPDRPEDTPKNQIPVDVPVTDDLYERYKTDFSDHYGIRNRNWPIEKIIIPYHPVDKATYLKKQFDKLPEYEKLPQPQSNLLDDDRTYIRPAPEGTSMSIVRNVLIGNVAMCRADGSIPRKDGNYKESTQHEIVPMKPNYWVNGNVDQDTRQDNETDNGAESDDEGDLFTQSYRAGSRTGPLAPIPPIDPGMAPESGTDIDLPREYSNSGFDGDADNDYPRKRQRRE